MCGYLIKVWGNREKSGILASKASIAIVPHWGCREGAAEASSLMLLTICNG